MGSACLLELAIAMHIHVHTWIATPSSAFEFVFDGTQVIICSFAAFGSSCVPVFIYYAF